MNNRSSLPAPSHAGFGQFLRWRIARLRDGVPPSPPADAFPRAAGDVAYPAVSRGEARITWVGHATFLIQLGAMNVLTDPIWSERASPVQFAGPRRLTRPGLAWDDLPPIHVVVLSHDHFDHLDRPTILRLVRRFGDALEWIAPPGFATWLKKRGATRVRELDWWERTVIAGTHEFGALPAQHWCARGPFSGPPRKWASWELRERAGRSVYFGGDSGYCAAFAEIGNRRGPFDAALLPIGAYEPRWFMRAAHMNPEEAVQAYRDLGGAGVFVPTHWGTFRLSDEDPLEPPARLRAAWTAAGMAEGRLRVLAHGGTLRL